MILTCVSIISVNLIFRVLSVGRSTLTWISFSNYKNYSNQTQNLKTYLYLIYLFSIQRYIFSRFRHLPEVGKYYPQKSITESKTTMPCLMIIISQYFLYLGHMGEQGVNDQTFDNQ